MNYGYSEPKIDQGHYFGGMFSPVPRVVVRPDGQWDGFLPKYEPQVLPDGEETNGCTVWGTQNALEILQKALFGGEPNYSERFTYNASGITPLTEGDAHEVAECIRRTGTVEEGDLPVTSPLSEFMKPRPATPALLRLAAQWLEDWEFMHEWAFVPGMDPARRAAVMKQNLMCSPLGISVTAWFERDGVYVDNGLPNCHWCVCYGWTDRGWKVFDSYDHSLKIVGFDHNIGYVKRYYLKKRQPGYFAYLIGQLLKALRDHGIIKKAD